MMDTANWMKSQMDNSLVTRNVFRNVFGFKGIRGHIHCYKTNGAEPRYYCRAKTMRDLVRAGLVSYIPADLAKGTSSYYELS